MRDTVVVPAVAPQVGGLVYLYHFSNPQLHAGHYLGAGGPNALTELQVPTRGFGRTLALSTRLAEVADVWETATLEEAHALAAKFRKQGSRRRLCSICNPGNGRGQGRGRGRKVATT